ncbi:MULTISPECIES: glycosyltransferase family 2 protein [unclassified Diaminobutyricimonas]|uniref:glycosyltransferase family 2 protein n=1 Tax=unclassified Diaminobutyricimonas TaxID=2643261 RepID=UPI0012F50C58|nr:MULTISPECIES: glycosyltransferase family 2 protein [unclassified Diaminobutyricimonas]
MSEPRVSVVIPAYNDAELLEKCLAALGAQTRPADEVIVVDNASTDATAAVARNAGARVLSEPVRGITRATALGFDAATGDVIARLDADSRPPADWIERVLALLEQSGASVVTGPGSFYDGGRIANSLGRHIYIGGYFWFTGLLLGHSPFWASNCALRAETWRGIRHRVHRDRRAFHDDLDMSFQLTTDMRVRYEKTLVMPVSARPFESAGALLRRIGWAAPTIWVNVRERLSRRSR